MLSDLHTLAINKVVALYSRLGAKSKRILSVLSICSLVSVSTLIPVSQADATSAFDSLINPITQLEIYSPGSSGGLIDVASTWRSAVAQCNPSASASLEYTIQHEGHWLVLLENPGPYADAYIRWTSDTSTSTYFHMNGSEARWGTSVGTYDVLRLNYVTSTGSVGCNYYANVSIGSSDPLITDPTASQLPIFLSTFPNTPTSGYAGADIPFGPTYGPITGQIECFNNDNVINSVYVTPSSGIAGYPAISGSGSSISYTYYPSEPSSSYQLSIDCGGVTQGTSPTNIDPSVYANPTWYCSDIVSSDCFIQ